jgi:hypothetical protein
LKAKGKLLNIYTHHLSHSREKNKLSCLSPGKKIVNCELNLFTYKTASQFVYEEAEGDAVALYILQDALSHGWAKSAQKRKATLLQQVPPTSKRPIRRISSYFLSTPMSTQRTSPHINYLQMPFSSISLQCSFSSLQTKRARGVPRAAAIYSHGCMYKKHSN